MRKKTIVLTGSTGRIGTEVSNYFSKLPDLSILPVSYQSKKEYYDYSDLNNQKFLSKIDIILHLACSSVPKLSEEIFGNEWLTDLPLLIKLLKSIKTSKKRNIHVIFFSSAGTIYNANIDTVQNEESPTYPHNMYGLSKLHAEQLLIQYAKRFPLCLTILRVSNVYGIRSKINDNQGIIPLIINAALNDTDLEIWGDGSSKKDYLHITDLIEALKCIIFNRITGIFNVCYGKSYSIIEIIEIVESILNKRIKLRYSSKPFWDNSNVFLNGDKLRKTIGWEPKVSILEGIKRYIEIKRFPH